MNPVDPASLPENGLGPSWRQQVLSLGNLRMLKHPCLLCDARPHQWCITKSGRRAGVLHSPRFYLAVEHGDLPLTGEEAGLPPS